MTIGDFIKKRSYLTWHVKSPERLSVASVVEAVLNYGDFNDFKTMTKIIGLKKTAVIFRSQIKNSRHNYRPEVVNYFRLYFQKHV